MAETMTNPNVGPEAIRIASNSRWTEPADEAPMFERPAWMRRGACVGMNTDDWLPERGQAAKAERAKAVCRGCPVIDECLAYALEHKSQGIWGGTSMLERQKIRGQRQRRGAA